MPSAESGPDFVKNFRKRLRNVAVCVASRRALWSVTDQAAAGLCREEHSKRYPRFLVTRHGVLVVQIILAQTPARPLRSSKQESGLQALHSRSQDPADRQMPAAKKWKSERHKNQRLL